VTALAAQIQNDSSIIIIENVTKDSFFIYEAQLQTVSDVTGFYHNPVKQLIQIIVQIKEFALIRKVIQQEIEKWNAMLDFLVFPVW
jgi:hypothetical protein